MMGKKKKDLWRGYTKSLIANYRSEKIGKKDKEAIRKALEQTRKMEGGECRVKMIEMVYIKKTHSLDGAAMILHYSPRSMSNWWKEFVELVADNRKLRG